MVNNSLVLKDGISEVDSIRFEIPELQKSISNWDEFSYTRDFLSPTDSWSFTISAENLELANEILIPGNVIKIYINDLIQTTGYIMEKQYASNRGGGNSITVTGRDFLGRLVDGNIDPNTKFKAGQKLEEVIKSVISQLELGGLTKIYSNDDLDIELITGTKKGRGGGKKKRKKRKASGSISDVTPKPKIGLSRDLSKIEVLDLKPQPNEGAYQFLDRILKTLGKRMWAAADGSGVIVDQPYYDGPSVYKFVRRRTVSDFNNVIDGTMTMNFSEQPSVVVAFGSGGGREFAKSKLVTIAVNELTAFDNTGNLRPNVQKILETYPNASVLDVREELFDMRTNYAKNLINAPIYISDPNSKSQEQLEYFAQQFLAKKQAKCFNLKYRVKGFSQDNLVYGINCLASVDDEIFNLAGDYWIKSKTFSKSRTGGTTTTLELIMPYTLDIGD